MADLVRDPVCGMEIRRDAAAASQRHGDQTLFFCSRECYATFLRDPGRYALSGHEGHGGHGHR